jgi:hypothetical protein
MLRPFHAQAPFEPCIPTRGWRFELVDPLPQAGRTAGWPQTGPLHSKPAKAQHDLPHWQHALEHLMRASAGSPAWLMFARMFILRAMRHGVERVRHQSQ